jgi:hypothetical protein
VASKGECPARAAEAAPLLKEALALFHKASSTKKDLLGEAESWRGACLTALGQPKEAEHLLVGGDEKMAAARGVGPRQRQRALAHVVRLCPRR